MIVVLGRPSVYRPEPDGELAPGGLVTEIARALAQEGAAVELAGSIGDDPEGDRVVVELGRAGVGHAAVLRDPAGHTPSAGPAPQTGASTLERTLPRMEAADVELALGYLTDCRVLVIADDLEPDALSAALRAADYHGAAVVIVAEAGTVDAEELGDGVTLLERPSSEDAASAGDEALDVSEAPAATPVDSSASSAFGGFVAAYALRLDRGESPARAFAAALGDSVWEPAAD